MTHTPAPDAPPIEPPKPWSWLVELLQSVGFAAAGVAVALAASGLLVAALGYDALAVYRAIWRGAFEDSYSFAEVLLQATPLILVGSGLAVAFRGSVWNIGAEGQIYMGTIAASVVALYVSLPGWQHLPLVLLTGVIAGAGWGALAGYLKARFGASEIVTTIMLNYLSFTLSSYLVTGPMIEKVGSYPQSRPIPSTAELLRFLPPTRLHIGLILAVILAVACYLFIFRTSAGYAVRAVGFNPQAAQYAGIDVNRNVTLVMAISGGLAGLAGAVQLTGLTHRLYATVSPGYGFDGIAVALMAGNNPLGVLLSGLFFGALRSGSDAMQITAKVPSVLVFAIQGLAIFAIVTAGVLRLRWEQRRERASSRALSRSTLAGPQPAP
jgi:ABC-type uncharacterized transport system permease subunit